MSVSLLGATLNQRLLNSPFKQGNLRKKSGYKLISFNAQIHLPGLKG